jgi:hypothetical protein
MSSDSALRASRNLRLDFVALFETLHHLHKRGGDQRNKGAANQNVFQRLTERLKTLETGLSIAGRHLLDTTVAVHAVAEAGEALAAQVLPQLSQLDNRLTLLTEALPVVDALVGVVEARVEAAVRQLEQMLRESENGLRNNQNHQLEQMAALERSMLNLQLFAVVLVAYLMLTRFTLHARLVDAARGWLVPTVPTPVALPTAPHATVRPQIVQSSAPTATVRPRIKSTPSRRFLPARAYGPPHVSHPPTLAPVSPSAFLSFLSEFTLTSPIATNSTSGTASNAAAPAAYDVPTVLGLSAAFLSKYGSVKKNRPTGPRSVTESMLSPTSAASSAPPRLHFDRLEEDAKI